jgi:O-antigen ligase
MVWPKKPPDIGTLLLIGYSGLFFFSTIANSPVEICGALVLGLWILSGRFLPDTKTWLKSPEALPVIGMILLPWIGLLYTSSPSQGLNMAARGYYWLYAIALVSVVRDAKTSDFLIHAFLAGLCVNAAASVLQVIHILPLRYGTPSGFLGISSPWITYTLLMTAGMCIASFYFRRASGSGPKLIYAFLMLLYFLTIGFVGGRSGYVAFIILSPLVVYNLLGGKHLGRIIVLTVLVISVLFSFPVVQNRFMQARKDLISYRAGNVNTSVGLRLHMWDVTFNGIKSHPFLGIGTNGFTRLWQENKKLVSLPFYDHPHNSFLYMVVSFGIPGLAVFCWLLFVMLKTGWRTFDSALGFSLFVFTLVFVIGSLTDTQLLVFPTMILFVLFSGCAAAWEQRQRAR